MNSLEVLISEIIEEKRVLKAYEIAYIERIKALTSDNNELKIGMLNKQDAINSYIGQISQLEKEVSIAKSDFNEIKRKLDSYATSKYVLDHIINTALPEGKNRWVGL